jgi:hypothetical protein
MSAVLKLEPMFLSEEEEREELERALGQIGHRSRAEIDAFASEFLGSLGQVQADRKRYADARKLEKERIDARYDRIEAPLLAREALLESAIKALAERQDFGPKKSRETANGTYGVKTKPAHLFIDDQDALLAWTLTLPLDKGPVVTTVCSIKQKDAQAYYKETGCEMPGCRFEPEQEIAYAKPEAK